MAESESEGAVHIIYTKKTETEEPEAYHFRTLASVLRSSEDAAKDKLLYSNKNAASGFSAKLTPQQVSLMSSQPGVLQVIPSRTGQLHTGGKPRRTGQPHSGGEASQSIGPRRMHM